MKILTSADTVSTIATFSHMLVVMADVPKMYTKQHKVRFRATTASLLVV